MRIPILSFLLLLFSVLSAYSQTKSLKAEKITDNEIKIDGIPNEEAWLSAQVATDFTQWHPNPGTKEKNKTEVRVIYNDAAIFVSAVMHVNEEIEISRKLTERDEEGLADYFIFVFDPFGDNALSYNFGVTAGGVQFDYKIVEYNSDYNWNEVWKSKVKINDNSWSVEMEIPYSAIRFPKEKKTERKVNFVRYINEGRRHLAWNPVDHTENNFNISNGFLTDFDVAKTPVRLSLSPYISAYADKSPNNDKMTYYFKGGADLKYGISESFTLDMMLIPDFGQVRSDDYSLNLSPYEIYYDERRSFFTEGTELFNRAGIFYSRRIGGTPKEFWSVEDQLNDHETISKNPSELQLLNATKISGKTKSGTSVGFLNAMSLRSNALLTDTMNNEERSFITQEFTNYNVTAVEQSFKNNSYFSLINTNMYIPNSDFMANVTGTEFKIAEKTNNYALFGGGAYSRNKHNADSIDDGYFTYLDFEKTKGNFKFSVANLIENDTYDPNFMGYLQNNNEIETDVYLNYTFYNPFEKVVQWHFQLFFENGTYYKPRHLLSNELGFHSCILFKSYFNMWLNAGGELGNIYNFDETRTEDRYFQQLRTNYVVGGFSTNYAKKLAFDMQGNYWKNIDEVQSGYYIYAAPRMQLSRSLLIKFGSSFSNNTSYGYTGTEANDIQFGLRHRKDVNNILDAKYIFNNRSSLILRISHIHSTVDYKGAYILDTDGYPQPADFEIDPIDFNMLNSYLVYNLEFAPGSFLSLAWKYEILHDENVLTENYFSALNNTLKQSPDNTVSLRLIFYLNYFTLKNRLKAR